MFEALSGVEGGCDGGGVEVEAAAAAEAGEPGGRIDGAAWGVAGLVEMDRNWEGRVSRDARRERSIVRRQALQIMVGWWQFCHASAHFRIAMKGLLHSEVSVSRCSLT